MFETERWRKKKISFPNSTVNRLVGKDQRRENMEDMRERVMGLGCERG